MRNPPVATPVGDQVDAFLHASSCTRLGELRRTGEIREVALEAIAVGVHARAGVATGGEHRGDVELSRRRCP